MIWTVLKLYGFFALISGFLLARFWPWARRTPPLCCAYRQNGLFFLFALAFVSSSSFFG